jgi:hypothetical protein
LDPSKKGKRKDLFEKLLSFVFDEFGEIFWVGLFLAPPPLSYISIISNLVFTFDSIYINTQDGQKYFAINDSLSLGPRPFVKQSAN